MEDWGGKLITFLIVFFLFWFIGSIVFGDHKIGFFIGLLAAGIFVGILIPKK